MSDEGHTDRTTFLPEIRLKDSFRIDGREHRRS